jgi:anti-anti-sigma regulatory factor
MGDMLKISILENGTRRQVVLEGKLTAPWTDEVKDAVQRAAAHGGHLELVIDLRSVTAISTDGEDVLLTFMQQGARFRVSGVFMRQVLKNLSRRSQAARDSARRD